MSTMDLNQVEARLDCPFCCRSKRLDGLLDLIFGHLLDLRERVREGYGTRSPHVVGPSANILRGDVGLASLSMPGCKSAV